MITSPLSPALTRLYQAWQTSNSILCCGLDPELEKLPAVIKSGKQPLLRFCKEIVDHTADLVCAFKLQIAFFSACGAEDEAVELIDYIRHKAPHVYIILDAKRGDIGNTAKMYAEEAFNRYKADAVTVNPYMGRDSIDPFTAYVDKGVIVLCRTSNVGSGEFQLTKSEQGEPLFMQVARHAAGPWNLNHNVLLVMGATYPSEIQAVRQAYPDVPFLIPGVGAQGGRLEDVIEVGKSKDGWGMLINASRSILYASSSANFGEAARQEAQLLNSQMNDLRLQR